MKDEEVELLDVDYNLKRSSDLNNSSSLRNNKEPIFHKIVFFLITFIGSFFLFFINFFWEVIYNIVIFLPFLFGKRSFPEIREKTDKFKEHPEIFLFIVLIVFIIIVLINFIVPNSPFRITTLPEEAKVDDVNLDSNQEKEDNSVTEENTITEENSTSNNEKLYQKYQNIDMNQIDINQLKIENSDTVGWLRVDSTNINYPVVQTTDNEFYINHNFEKQYNKNGWIFGDYRNTWDVLKKNTIIYGHHLLNKTMFGTVSKMFTEDWQKNSTHLISFKIGNSVYYWAIFSVYEIPTELYYLANEFTSETAFKNFVSTLKSRTVYDFNVDVSNVSNILTLSTCNDKNDGRLVVHAVLIQ